jgi:hypothetical protein
MDMEEPVFMPAAAAVADAASGGVAEALGSNLDQLKLLEKSLNDLKRETQATRTNESGLKARLAEAEAQSRIVPWLFGLLLLAAGVAAWLAFRLKTQGGKVDKSAAPETWWSALPDGTGPVPEPPPSIVGELGDAPTPAPVSARPSVARHAPLPTVAELPADSAPEFDEFKTLPLAGAPGAYAATANMPAEPLAPAREVSVEELLDLEQQADFFIALGQEDAAGDLLMSHLRSTGGQSPLPYTKLLEIYRRQGDRSAYERIRARFNRRFNVYAPDWEVGPLHGRSLEDYPDVIQRLQELWPSHLNSMAVLEAMLFRNDERQEMYDLPAYKDVLLLYSLARDLYQTGGVTNADVDLLLPLGDDLAHVQEPLPASQRTSSYDMTAFSLDLPEEGGAVIGHPADKH